MKKIIIGTLVFSLINTTIYAWSLTDSKRDSSGLSHYINCNDSGSARIVTITEGNNQYYCSTNSGVKIFGNINAAANCACQETNNYSSSSSSSSSSSDSGSFWGTAGKVLLGLAAAGAAASMYQDSQGYIVIDNKCSERMIVHIKYLPINSKKWATATGNIYPNSEGYFTKDGKELRTDNAVLYYQAESAYNDKFIIEGNNKVYVDGKKYWMKKLVDKKGNTEIYLRCK